jgi:ABC-type glutathione transport system ATPase component
MSEPLLLLDGLAKSFATGSWWRPAGTRAVDNVTLRVMPGETLGIVGESGSGKSTLLRMALRLIRPTTGRVLLGGRDVWAVRGAELKGLRRAMQPVFQDPGASFNPRQTVRRILLTPLEVHGVASRERAARLDEALGVVGLAPALLDRYPHQLSGGQKQRVAVARAVVLKPSLLLLDEPTSALDVSVQAQVLNLFQRTKRELGLTCLFVSHNLAVIRYVSDRVAVMRHGRLIEEGPAAKLFDDPQHSYTQALLRAVPDVARGLAERRAARQRQQAQGAVP